MGDEFHLVKTFGPAAKLNLILKAIFFWRYQSSNLENNLFKFMALIFLQF